MHFECACENQFINQKKYNLRFNLSLIYYIIFIDSFELYKNKEMATENESKKNNQKS